MTNNSEMRDHSTNGVLALLRPGEPVEAVAKVVWQRNLVLAVDHLWLDRGGMPVGASAQLV